MTLALYCVTTDGKLPQLESPETRVQDAGNLKKEEELERILEKIKQKMSDIGEYEEDSMDIMTPWEDKYGNRDQEPPAPECNEDNTL